MPRVGAIQYAEPRGSFVSIITNPCVVCGKTHQLLVDIRGYENWQYGEKIQDAFPDMNVGVREMLISGTCSSCFDNMFKEEDEDDE